MKSYKCSLSEVRRRKHDVTHNYGDLDMLLTAVIIIPFFFSRILPNLARI